MLEQANIVLVLIVVLIGSTSMVYAQGIQQQNMVSITAEMEVDDDSGLFGVLNEYEITEFDMSIAPELLCPSDPCVYELEEGMFREHTYRTNTYVMDGTLKVSDDEDMAKYNLLDLRADLHRSDISGNEETLHGSLKLQFPGSDKAYQSFDISDSSVEFDGDSGTLNIHGENANDA